MAALALALCAALVGGFVVGPFVALAAQHWIGWRVIVPQLTGYVAPRREISGLDRREWRKPRWAVPISVVTAIALGLAALRLGWSAALLPLLALSAGMVAVSVVDLQCWRIPTLFVYATAAAVLVGLGVEAVVDGDSAVLTAAAIGTGVYLAILGGMHLVSPRMMGFGDVRLGGVIGLVVGPAGWRESELLMGAFSWSLLGIMLASVFGTVAGGVVLVLRRRSSGPSSGLLKEPFPYGPWLCLGGYLTVLLAGA